MTYHQIKIGEIAYARPGDRFAFTPPNPGKSYRFQVGPKSGKLEIMMWNPTVGTGQLIRNQDGEDHLDHKCSAEKHEIYVLGCRTAYQFVVTRTPNKFLAWIKSLFGH